MFKVTATLVIVALAGTPAIAKGLIKPLALLSGTVTLIIPELTVTDPGTAGPDDALNDTP